MSESLTQLWDEFAEKLEKQEETRRKMEVLHEQNQLTDFDILTVYDGLFLSLFTDFEEFLEKLFWGLLKKEIDIQEFGQDAGLVAEIHPIEKTELIILGGGKNYLNWFPYDQTKARANLFFQSGIPFGKLTNQEEKELGYYHTIRNAIAHKSPQSKKKFQNMIEQLRFFAEEDTPSHYLRSKPSGEQTHFEIATGQLLLIARKLCGIES